MFCAINASVDCRIIHCFIIALVRWFTAKLRPHSAALFLAILFYVPIISILHNARGGSAVAGYWFFGPWAEEEAPAIVHPLTSCCLAPKQLYGALIDAKFQVEKRKKLNFMAILCANHHKFPAAGFLATSAPLAAQDEGGWGSWGGRSTAIVEVGMWVRRRFFWEKLAYADLF